jgi:type IV pilus assembly protein PilM
MSISETIEATELEKVAPQLMVAAGLALRSFSPWHI